MNFLRRKKSIAPDLSAVEQAPLSVFESETAPASRDTEQAQDVAFVEVLGERDDDVPFGPELPDHVVAGSERDRRKRKIRLGAPGVQEALPPQREFVTAPVAQTAASSMPPVKASRWPFKRPGAGDLLRTQEASEKETEAASGAESKPATKNAHQSLRQRLAGLASRKGKAAKPSANFPVRVLIGFLPEVTERDALSFALGVAEKHCESIENAHFDAFPHQGGFVYEVHEGGTGAAFTPAILDYFESLGPFRSEVDARMHIRTATRTVEVIRKPAQIEAVLLPESAGLQTTPEPSAGPLMRLAMNKRTGFLVAGASIFITGFFAAIIIGAFMRLVPADDIRQPPPERLDLSQMPAGQWGARLQNVPEGKYVKALRYDRKAKWRTENADVVEPTLSSIADAAAPVQPTAPAR